MFTIQAAMSFLGNKYVIFALIIGVIISFYQVKVWAMEHTISSQKIEIAELTIDKKNLNSDLDDAVKINKNNTVSIKEYEQSIKDFKQNTSLVITSKDKEISSLKNIISKYNTKTRYKNTVYYDKCSFKIKNKDEIDENDTIFNSISNIGNI